MSVQVGVHSSSEPSSPRPPKHHVGGGSAASAATVVASCRKSGGEGGESGGEGGGVGLSVRRHSVICSSKVGDRGDCSSSACSSSTTGATVLQTGVGSVGGGATEIGDSFFLCAMRRGLMCALLIVDGGAPGSMGWAPGGRRSMGCTPGGSPSPTSIRRRSASGRRINSATRCCTRSMALNSTGGSPNRACMTTTSSVYLLSDPPLPAP